MNNVDSLPDSSKKEFWGEAEINTNLVPQKVHSDGPHYFIRKSGKEAQCTHCDWGFELDPGDFIRDGHLYDMYGKCVL